MAIGYSTGRGTRVRHSTAMEWEDMEKVKKKYDPVKHATGEQSTVRHATGTEFDFKVLHRQEEERLKKRSGCHSKPPAEGDEYLELFQRSLAGKRLKETKGGRGPK